MKLTTGFKKPIDSDNYVLLAGGGHKSLSDFTVDGKEGVLASKTYTDIYNIKNYGTYQSYYGFLRFFPTDATTLWTISYRIYGYSLDANKTYQTLCTVEFSGYGRTLTGSKVFTDVRNYAYCHNTFMRNKSNDATAVSYGNIIGIYFNNTNNDSNTSYKRTFEIDLLSATNCTYEFLEHTLASGETIPTDLGLSYCSSNSFIVGSSNIIFNTGWEINTNYNANTNGLRETGVSNDTGYYIISNGTRFKSGNLNINYYGLLLKTGNDGTYDIYSGLHSNITANTLATTKSKNTIGFLPDGKIYYRYSGSMLSKNTICRDNLYEQYHSIDGRCNFNITTTSWAANTPIYLVFTFLEGKLYLCDEWLATSLPTSEDGKIYLLVGYSYENEAYYTHSLLLSNPYYKYINSSIQSWSPIFEGGYLNGDLKLKGSCGINFNNTDETSIYADSGIIHIKHSNGISFDDETNSESIIVPTNKSGTVALLTDIPSLEEASLAWGTKSIVGDISPIDAAIDQDIALNRVAFLDTNAIEITYSLSGTVNASNIDSLTSYNHTAAVKTGVVTGSSSTKISLGNFSGTLTSSNYSGLCTVIKIFAGSNSKDETCYVYTTLKKLLIKATYAGHTLNVDIYVKYEGSDTISLYKSGISLGGWPGWNSIYMDGLLFGGELTLTTHLSTIYLKFYISKLNTSYTTSIPGIYNVHLLGTDTWYYPSNMSKTGHIYSYDTSQNVVFPGSIRTNSTLTVDSTLLSYGEIRTTNSNCFRSVNGNYGVRFLNNGSEFKITFTNSKDLYGTNIRLTPLSLNISSGLATFGNGLAITGDCTTSGSYYANSDIRYKNIITDINISSKDISLLPIFKYTWSNKKDTLIHIGSSAQSVEKILPLLITTKDDFKSLDYSILGTVGSIIACREIENLKQRIKKLEEKINGLFNCKME